MFRPGSLLDIFPDGRRQPKRTHHGPPLLALAGVLTAKQDGVGRDLRNLPEREERRTSTLTRALAGPSHREGLLWRFLRRRCASSSYMRKVSMLVEHLASRSLFVPVGRLRRRSFRPLHQRQARGCGDMLRIQVTSRCRPREPSVGMQLVSGHRRFDGCHAARPGDTAWASFVP